MFLIKFQLLECLDWYFQSFFWSIYTLTIINGRWEHLLAIMKEKSGVISRSDQALNAFAEKKI